MTWLRRTLVGGCCGVATAIVALPALSGNDDFACEEAVAHLVSCCPQIDPGTFDCTRDFDCGGDAVSEPDIDGRTAACLGPLSCGEIQSKGICGTAATTPENITCD